MLAMANYITYDPHFLVSVALTSHVLAMDTYTTSDLLLHVAVVLIPLFWP